MEITHLLVQAKRYTYYVFLSFWNLLILSLQAIPLLRTETAQQWKRGEGVAMALARQSLGEICCTNRGTKRDPGLANPPRLSPGAESQGLRTKSSGDRDPRARTERPLLAVSLPFALYRRSAISPIAPPFPLEEASSPGQNTLRVRLIATQSKAINILQISRMPRNASRALYFFGGRGASGVLRLRFF